MNVLSQIFFNNINHGYRGAILKKSYLWLLPFYMAGATYCYYEKVCRTTHTATVSYLLKVKTLKIITYCHFGPKSGKNLALTSFKCGI